MKAMRTHRRRTSPVPVAPSLQIDLEGDWRCYTRLLPKDCEVLGVVTIAGDDHGALVKVIGGEVTILNQNRVRMKLLGRQQHSQALEMVAVD